MVRENLIKVQQKIDEACERSGRDPKEVTLIAVSKTKPIEMIEEAIDAGKTQFGENKAQEMKEKYEALPKNLEWHFIGHLQTNKIKYMAPYVSMIHGIDSYKLLAEVNKQAEKVGRTIKCLLQLHIAQEETKFGFSADECRQMLATDDWKSLKNVKIWPVTPITLNK